MRFKYGAKEVLIKYKPLIIIVVLFLMVFALKAEAVNISAVPQMQKAVTRILMDFHILVRWILILTFV